MYVGDRFLLIPLKTYECCSKHCWDKEKSNFYRCPHRTVFLTDFDIILETASVIEIHQKWSSRLHHVNVLLEKLTLVVELLNLQQFIEYCRKRRQHVVLKHTCNRT